MKIRGNRVCKSCGTSWSYFETDGISCPNCGSLESVGTDDERILHTDSPVDLHLAHALERLDERPLREVADEITTSCRDYIRNRGFVRAGSLVELDDRFLVAHELTHALNEHGRSISGTGSIDRDALDPESMYLVTLLLEAGRGNRPDVPSVPDRFRAPRALAYAAAVDRYKREVNRWIQANRSHETDVKAVLERLDDHLRRTRALDGDVPLSTGEGLIEVAREVGRYLIDGDEDAIVRAHHRLDTIAE